jgi:hypothetical protein
VEDFGEGQLVAGQAQVRLDPELAALVRGDAYLVFLTPEGDSRGLYVAGKGPTGFAVQEQQGGTSSLPFGLPGGGQAPGRPRAAPGAGPAAPRPAGPAAARRSCRRCRNCPHRRRCRGCPALHRGRAGAAEARRPGGATPGRPALSGDRSAGR